jgi:hypothetical protein
MTRQSMWTEALNARDVSLMKDTLTAGIPAYLEFCELWQRKPSVEEVLAEILGKNFPELLKRPS